MTIGLRSTGITNVDGGTLCFNNILIVKNGALWRCANTSSKSVCVGDANLFGLSQTALPLNPTNYARAVTGNCIRIEQGGVVTGASTVWISPSNRIELLGGQFSASMISNKGGLFKGWGLQFAHSVTNLTNYTYDGGVLYPLSSQGTLIISNTSVVIETNGIMQIELGTNTSVNATQWKMGPETTNAFLHIKGTLQFTNPPGAGAVAPGKYRLIAYSPTNALGAPWNNSVRYSGSIGLPLPDPSFGYSISSNVVGNIGYINLDVLRFEVTSIVRQAGTNVVLTWTGPTNAVYRVQATAGGNYSTNSFADISADVSSTSPVNSYTETNGTSAGANRYYRVRIKP